MRQLMTLTRVEAALLLREPAAVLFTLALPLVLLALNGAQGNVPQPELGGVGLVDVMIPGFLVYVMATTAIMVLPETLADYRDKGILRRMRISPLKPVHIIGSHALTHLVMIIAGVLLLVAVGMIGYDLSVPAALAPTALAIAVSAGSTVAIGFLLGSVLPTVRTTQAIAAALFFPAIFVSGAMWPREALPDFARTIGDFLPLTYAVRAIREAWSAGAADWTAIGILAATTVIASVIALRTFRWESR
jgi:ABC-2 type transport system permease protein